jgi:gluconate 2-dehydrogenase
VRPELLALRNVVLTPHIGSASLATRTAMVQLAVDNLVAGLGLDGARRACRARSTLTRRCARDLGKKPGNDREPPRAPLEEVPRTQLSCVFSPFPFS